MRLCAASGGKCVCVSPWKENMLVCKRGVSWCTMVDRQGGQLGLLYEPQWKTHEKSTMFVALVVQKGSTLKITLFMGFRHPLCSLGSVFK